MIKASTLKTFSLKNNIKGFTAIIFLIFNCFNLLAEKPCGIILGGLKNDGFIIRKNTSLRSPMKVNMVLYDGDLIVQEKGIEKIRINLSPFAKKIPIHLIAFYIEYTPPEKKRILPKFLRWIKNLESAIHITHYATTRGIEDEIIEPDKLYPFPGWKSSVLPGDHITFRWESRLARFFIIKDFKDNIIIKKELNSKSSIDLNIDEIGMKPFLKYYWGIKIKGINLFRTDYELRLLDDDIAKIVESGLIKIENEQINPTFKEIKKAAFYQFISDKYCQSTDLYWKSGEILAKIDQNKLDDKYTKEYKLLLINLRDHNERMSRRVQ